MVQIYPHVLILNDYDQKSISHKTMVLELSI